MESHLCINLSQSLTHLYSSHLFSTLLVSLDLVCLATKEFKWSILKSCTNIHMKKGDNAVSSVRSSILNFFFFFWGGDNWYLVTVCRHNISYVLTYSWGIKERCAFARQLKKIIVVIRCRCEHV